MTHPLNFLNPKKVGKIEIMCFKPLYGIIFFYLGTYGHVMLVKFVT